MTGREIAEAQRLATFFDLSPEAKAAADANLSRLLERIGSQGAMNDDLSNAKEIPPEMIVYLPPAVYESAEKSGVDMRYYRRTENLPCAGITTRSRQSWLTGSMSSQGTIAG